LDGLANTVATWRALLAEAIGTVLAERRPDNDAAARRMQMEHLAALCPTLSGTAAQVARSVVQEWDRARESPLAQEADLIREQLLGHMDQVGESPAGDLAGRAVAELERELRRARRSGSRTITLRTPVEPNLLPRLGQGRRSIFLAGELAGLASGLGVEASELEGDLALVAALPTAPAPVRR
jgi:hypothetical protein